MVHTISWVREGEIRDGEIRERVKPDVMKLDRMGSEGPKGFLKVLLGCSKTTFSTYILTQLIATQSTESIRLHHPSPKLRQRVYA